MNPDFPGNMDASVSDKEEIKRRLEEMKMKYAKMQRKLTKSERRKKAKNHVRRVLAEQASAPSAHMHDRASSDLKVKSSESVDSQEKRKVTGGAPRATWPDKSIQRFRQRSISFKLNEKSDDRRMGGQGYPAAAVAQECRTTLNHSGCRSPAELCKKESVQTCSGRETDGGTKCEAIKVSRLSHNNKNQRRRQSVENLIDRLNEVNDSAGFRNKRMSPSCESGLSPKGITENAIVPEVRPNRRVEKEGHNSTKSPPEVDDTGRLCLRHLGVIQKRNKLCTEETWDGICLHQAMAFTALIVHRSQTAVLWLHKESWEAKSHWSTDKGVLIDYVAMDRSNETQLYIVFTLKRGSEKELCFVTYNIETDTEDLRIEKLSGSLKDAESVRIIQNGADGGAAMETTTSGYHHIHFFDTTDEFYLWQSKGLEGVEAESFISVEGASNCYMCLSSGYLSLWTPKSDAPILDFDLDEASPELEVDRFLWSKAEEGLLFVITFKKPSNLSLSVVNPVTKSAIQINRFNPPCSYQTLRVVDTAICGRYLSVLFSNQKMLIWDICTGRPLVETKCPDKHLKQITGSSQFLVLNGEQPHLYSLCKLKKE